MPGITDHNGPEQVITLAEMRTQFSHACNLRMEHTKIRIFAIVVISSNLLTLVERDEKSEEEH